MKSSAAQLRHTLIFRLAQTLGLLLVLTYDLHAGTTITVGSDGSNVVDSTDYLDPAVNNLIKNGTNTVSLTGTSTYTGGTAINAGILQIGNGSTIGSIVGNVADFGTLAFNRSDDITFNGNITGDSYATVQQNGTGTLTLGGNNISLNLIINSGKVALGSATALGTLGGVTINGSSTLDLNGHNAATGFVIGTTGTTITNNGATNITLSVDRGAIGTDDLASAITDGTGTIALTKTGGSGAGSNLLLGVLKLSGANTYSGGTNLNSGYLQLNNASALGTGKLTITGTSYIDNVTGAALTLSTNNTISLVGDLIFAATNSLNLGTGAVTLGGTGTTRTITFGSTFNSLTLGGVISGPTGMGLTLAGQHGGLILTAANIYTGTTTIPGGLVLALNENGTAGSGPIANFGLLTLNQTSDSTLANIISGTGDLTTSGNGTLTVTGNNSYSGITTVNNGTIKLGSDTALGQISSLQVSAGTVDLNGHNATVRFLTGDGNSIITNSAASTSATLGIYGNSTFAGIIQDGAGLTSLVMGDGALTLSAQNTYSGGTTLNGGTLNINNDSAIGTGKLIISGVSTLGNTSSDARDLSANTSNQDWNADFTYTGNQNLTLTSGDVTMNASRIVTVNTSNGAALIVPGAITGSATTSLTISGNGIFVFEGDNTYGGTTTIDGAYAALGHGSTGSLASTSNVVLKNFGIFEIDRSDSALNFANIISGNGSLSKGDAGTVTISGANTFTGDTDIANGTLIMGNAKALGSATNWLEVRDNNSTLDLNGNTLTVGNLNSYGGTTGVITNNGANATLTVNPVSGTNGTFDNTIQNGSGIIALVKSGAGSLTLSGNNTFSGGTTITNGTLNINSSSALGSGSITIAAEKNGSITIGNTSNSMVVLANAETQSWQSDFTYNSDNQLSFGSGTVNLVGTRTITLSGGGVFTVGGVLVGDKTATGLKTAGIGTLVLAGDNTYTGTTTIAAGTTLQLGIGNGTGNLSGKVMNSGILAFERGPNVNAPFVFASAISGKGSVIKDNTETLTLTGKNSYSGGTTLYGGTVVLGNAKALGSTKGDLSLVGGRLDLDGFQVTVGNLDGNGMITNNSTTAATLTVNSTIDTGFGGSIKDGANATVALVKSGKGLLALTGNNTYTGVTTIKSGTLQIGGGGTLHTGSIASASVVNSGILSFFRTYSGGYSGVISGKGSVEQNGSGTITLTGANTYTGTTTMNSGTLVVGNATALGVGKKANVILNFGTLETNGAIHQINVGGNLSLSSNSTIALTLTLDADTESVNVGGSVSLLDAGPFVFFLTPSGFTDGNRDLVILTAAKGFGKLTGSDFGFSSSDDHLSGTFSIAGNDLVFNSSYGPPPADSAAPAFSSFSEGGPQPVPEPSTWAMLVFGGIVLLVAGRRRICVAR